nr:hypothetical protein [Secundilactobacillus kimchicus]
MSEVRANLITLDEARALLKESKSQKDEFIPKLATTGQYILPDYRLTRKREAFKIRKHIFLKRQYKSYVAFDSENGQTLWMHNFSSLSQALFWLATGLKPGDSDSSMSFKDWMDHNQDQIDELKK